VSKTTKRSQTGRCEYTRPLPLAQYTVSSLHASTHYLHISTIMESTKMSTDREPSSGDGARDTSNSSPVEILLFGDSTANIDRHFQQLLNRKSNAELQSLFNHAGLAFRQEFSRLPRDQHDWFPRFTNMIDLVAGVEGTIGEPALRLALLCIYQVGLVLE